MRPAILLALAACSHALLAQELGAIRLGNPQFVAKNVQNVHWAPDGKSLAYTTKEADGLWLGVYDLDRAEGKSVLKLNDGDELQQVDWLNVSKKAVIVVDNAKSGRTVTLTVVDARAGAARQVWSRQFKSEESPSVTVDASPLLAHALVTIESGKTNETWVLIQGASGLTFSRDIAAAQAQGHSFAGWTQAGTAVFGATGGQSTWFTGQGAVKAEHVLIGKVLADSGAAVQSEKPVELTLSPAKTVVAFDRAMALEVGSTLKLRFRMMPMLEKGANCLECVPSNGALRPVRFPGYFEGLPDPTVVPEVLGRPALLKIGKTETGTQALWLVPQPKQPADDATEKAPPTDPEGGVLVSAQADSWWPAPFTRSIAFVWNGALFVRTVQYPKT